MLTNFLSFVKHLSPLFLVPDSFVMISWSPNIPPSHGVVVPVPNPSCSKAGHCHTTIKATPYTNSNFFYYFVQGLYNRSVKWTSYTICALMCKTQPTQHFQPDILKLRNISKTPFVLLSKNTLCSQPFFQYIKKIWQDWAEILIEVAELFVGTWHIWIWKQKEKRLKGTV